MIVEPKTIILSASLTVSTIVDVLKSNQRYEAMGVAGLLDDCESKADKTYYGLKVLGTIKSLPDRIQAMALSHFIVGLGSVKHMLIRGHLFEACERQGLLPADVVHSQVYISSNALVGRGSIILPFASVSTGCTIGHNSCINNSVSILENCRLGSNVLIAGNTFLGAQCEIGNNVYIGPGVTIGSGVRIGDNTVVGAGSLVLRDLPGNVFACGAPISKVLPNRHYLSALPAIP